MFFGPCRNICIIPYSALLTTPPSLTAQCECGVSDIDRWAETQRLSTIPVGRLTSFHGRYDASFIDTFMIVKETNIGFILYFEGEE